MLNLAKRILKNRVLVTLFAVTIIWLSLTMAFTKTASMQSTLYQEEIFFYTNVSKTDLCGYWNTCTGEAWGCITQYRQIHMFICPEVQP